MAACNLNFPALDDSACVLAIKANGTLDATFDQDGQRSFRFSQYASEIRAPGSSVLQRLLVRDDGAMYLLGTHFNEDAGDFASYEQKDVAVLRMESNGSVIESGPQVFAGDGITLPSLAEANQSVSEAERLRTTEEMVDATWYKGNILFIADRARYQRYQYDHDGDGILDEQGPIAPVVASLVGESLFNADFDFDGIDGYLAGVPAITEPAGYGHYCSVRNPSNGSYGVLPQGSGSDPCQVYLDDNPNLIVERSGLYLLSPHSSCRCFHSRIPAPTPASATRRASIMIRSTFQLMSPSSVNPMAASIPAPSTTRAGTAASATRTPIHQPARPTIPASMSRPWISTWAHHDSRPRWRRVGW